MAVGFPREKGDIDDRAGRLAVKLRDTFGEIERFAELLALGNDAYFADMGWTVEEVATLRGAYTDLYKLAQIYRGGATQGSAYDFRAKAKLLTGVL